MPDTLPDTSPEKMPDKLPEKSTGKSPQQAPVSALSWYALALAILVADQLTKQAATQWLEYARPQRVWSWFNFTLHHNTGAAFSFLSDAGGWQRWFFALLAVTVCVVLAIWIRTLQRGQWSLALGLALILGGALGNLVDRVWLGYVVDFISVHYHGSFFPTFNVADSAISVGAALVVLDSLRGGGVNTGQSDPEGSGIHDSDGVRAVPEAHEENKAVD